MAVVGAHQAEPQASGTWSRDWLHVQKVAAELSEAAWASGEQRHTRDQRQAVQGRLGLR